MKRALVVFSVVLFAFAGVLAAQEKQVAKTKAGAPPLEAKVQKLWEAFQKKDKATLSSLIDDGFRQFEEGMTAFADKKAEVNAVDEYELLNFKLSDFNIRPLGPNSAVVTYIADYEGKTGGETAKAKSVFGEVWTRSSGDWRALYMQETYVK